MKKLSLSQMKILAVAALSLAMVMSFQNCSKAPLDGSTTTGSADEDLLKNDPLKSDRDLIQSSMEREGGLYHLVMISDPSAPQEKNHTFTAGAFTLQFSSLQDVESGNSPAASENGSLEVVMKDVTFKASSGCYRQHIGMGRMARFKNMPMRTGALELKVTSNQTIAALVDCSLQASDVDQSLIDGDAFNQVLEGARAYVIQGSRLYFLDGQGRQAIFQRVDTEALARQQALLSALSKTLLAKKYLSPDGCAENKADAQGRASLECKQLITEKDFTLRHSFKAHANRSVDIQLACGPLLSARLNEDGRLSQVRQKNPDEIHAMGCESTAMKESGEITAILSRSPQARVEGQQVILTTNAGIQLILE